MSQFPPNPTLKKPTRRRDYGEVLADWLKQHPSEEDSSLPEAISDQYTVAEKESYYEEVAERATQEALSKSTTPADPMHLRDVPKEQIDQLLQEAKKSFGQGRTNEGTDYEVFDLQALDWRPNADLTVLDGTQEFLNPLGGLSEDEFEKLKTDDTSDSLIYVRQLDPKFRQEHWLPPTLESKLASLRQGKFTRSIEQWKNSLIGHVSTFIEISRQTRRCVQLTWFVR
jgi:hypothetical protein